MRISISEAKRLGLVGNKDVAGLSIGKKKKVGPRIIRDVLDARAEPSGMVVIFIAGKAISKARARTVNGGMHTYTPKETVKFAKAVREAGSLAMIGHRPFHGSLRADILIVRKIPESWSKKKRRAALDGTLLPIQKPDRDNLDKNILDALEGVVFKNDAQICEGETKKRFGEEPYVLLEISAVKTPTERVPTADEAQIYAKTRALQKV